MLANGIRFSNVSVPFTRPIRSARESSCLLKSMAGYVSRCEIEEYVHILFLVEG